MMTLCSSSVGRRDARGVAADRGTQREAHPGTHNLIFIQVLSHQLRVLQNRPLSNEAERPTPSLHLHPSMGRGGERARVMVPMLGIPAARRRWNNFERCNLAPRSISGLDCHICAVSAPLGTLAAGKRCMRRGLREQGGVVEILFRALSGRLKFTVRRHKFNEDSLSVVAGSAVAALCNIDAPQSRHSKPKTLNPNPAFLNPAPSTLNRKRPRRRQRHKHSG